MDIATDLLIAQENQKLGNIKEAQKFYTDYMYEYNKEMVFVNKHIEFLLSIGDYDTIIRRYGHLNLEQVKKAKEYLKIINTRDYKKISKLINISGYSSLVIKSSIKENIKNNLKETDILIKKGIKIYPEDLDFKKYLGQYLCLVGEYSSGMNILNELGYFDISDNLEYYIKKFDNIKKYTDISSKISNLRNLYNSVNSKTFSDSFSPSVYTNLCMSILYELINLGTKHGYSKLSSLSKILYKYKNDEESRYMYIISLIQDGYLDQAKRELNLSKFRNINYENLINNKFEKIRKDKEEKENQKQQEYYEQQERQIPRTEKAGTDFLGYYKLLGVNKDTKLRDIKKAYAKIIAKNTKMIKTDKQKEEWEKKHVQYNKALQVLTNEKKKKIYDNGVDPESPQAQYSRHNQQQHKQFKGNRDFFEFFNGFDNDFRQGFRQSGFRQGGFRQGGQTQFFFF